MEKFTEIKAVDNFYQASLFFPMPTIAITTVAENGQTNIGSYSLCFPYYIAGKDYYAMILEVRNSSNTAQNILHTGKCTLNFITDDKKAFKELVRLGFPGKTTDEKMKDCIFDLVESDSKDEGRPKVLSEAYQIIECSWDDTLEDAYKDKERIGQLEGVEPPYRNFNGITSKYGCHFILKIDKILMKDKYAQAIKNGVKKNAFPKVPVDYGYRDSKNFWYTGFGKKPHAEPIAGSNAMSVESVIFCAERLDTDVKFSHEACAQLVRIPRVFLKAALLDIVAYCDRHGIKEVTPDVLKANMAEKKGKKF